MTPHFAMATNMRGALTPNTSASVVAVPTLFRSSTISFITNSWWRRSVSVFRPPAQPHHSAQPLVLADTVCGCLRVLATRDGRWYHQQMSCKATRGSAPGPHGAAVRSPFRRAGWAPGRGRGGLCWTLDLRLPGSLPEITPSLSELTSPGAPRDGFVLSAVRATELTIRPGSLPRGILYPSGLGRATGCSPSVGRCARPAGTVARGRIRAVRHDAALLTPASRRSLPAALRTRRAGGPRACGLTRFGRCGDAARLAWCLTESWARRTPRACSSGFVGDARLAGSRASRTTGLKNRYQAASVGEEAVEVSADVRHGKLLVDCASPDRGPGR